MTTTTKPAPGTRVEITKFQGGAAVAGSKGTVIERETRDDSLAVKIDGSNPSYGAFGDGIHAIALEAIKVLTDEEPVKPDFEIGKEYVLGTNARRYSGSTLHENFPVGARVFAKTTTPDRDGEIIVQSVEFPTWDTYVMADAVFEPRLILPDFTRLDPQAVYVLHEPKRCAAYTGSGVYSGLVEGARVKVQRAIPDQDGEIFAILQDGPAAGSGGYVTPDSLRLVALEGPPPEEESAPAAPAEDPALAEMRLRVERAERELEDFKNLVRSKVIEEAEEQGWCDRTDGWLRELGLPDRYGDLPTCLHSVIALDNGNVAILSDMSDDPWSERDVETGQHIAWRTFAQVAPRHKTTLHNGGEEDHRDR